MGSLFNGNFAETRPIYNTLKYFYEHVTEKNHAWDFYTDTLEKVDRQLKEVDVSEEDAEELSNYLVGEARYHVLLKGLNRDMGFEKGMFLSILSLLIEVLRKGPPWKD